MFRLFELVHRFLSIFTLFLSIFFPARLTSVFVPLTKLFVTRTKHYQTNPVYRVIFSRMGGAAIDNGSSDNSISRVRVALLRTVSANARYKRIVIVYAYGIRTKLER